MFFNSGRKKRRAFTAFSFPFVANRRSARRVVVWGKSPVTGTLSIERRHRGRWRDLSSVPVTAGASGAVFRTHLRLTGAATLRATIDNRHSLPWTVHNRPR